MIPMDIRSVNQGLQVASPRRREGAAADAPGSEHRDRIDGRAGDVLEPQPGDRQQEFAPLAGVDPEAKRGAVMSVTMGRAQVTLTPR